MTGYKPHFPRFLKLAFFKSILYTASTILFQCISRNIPSFCSLLCSHYII
nr:MAG TPA_asm: hypothetical protein [Caudoviricetes sp.]